MLEGPPPAKTTPGVPPAVTPVKTLADMQKFALVFKQSEPLKKAMTRTRKFFTSTDYNPSLEPPDFGALSFFFGSFMVTFGAILLAVPLGISAAVCLSDVLPFAVRQWVKPMIEIIAAIPSVAYGFFALVVFAPLLQHMGGKLICGAILVIGIPLGLFSAVVVAELVVDKLRIRAKAATTILFLVFAGVGGVILYALAHAALGLQIASGTNALNVSIILGIMALPTIVSVSEDALQAVPRNIREGSYGLGATRAETMLLTVIPSAASGIVAAVILGIMRAVGETMVVWMAAGNARALPKPLYNYLAPIRTLTATIAGDMGEADQSTGSLRYHVLFAMAFCLLTISFCMNLASEWVVRRQRRKLEGQ
jgi:phosphate transport system permease protein